MGSCRIGVKYSAESKNIFADLERDMLARESPENAMEEQDVQNTN